MLLGMSKPIHVVTQSVTARGIVNVSAIAAVEAQALRMQAAHPPG
jgi:malate dehydrogenase (oxaloacetate-decarboxylating)(NADP+)